MPETGEKDIRPSWVPLNKDPNFACSVMGGIDSGVNAVLLQIEYGAGISQGIETAEDARAVEIGHHLSRFDLVEAQGIFLDNDECIGHQTGLFQCRILHHCINAVGCILTVGLIPYKR